MPGIAVVSNPRSRQNRRNPAIAGQLAYLLGDRGQMAQPRGLEDLVETARRFRDQGVDVLAINGGDGTAHVVLTAFMKAYEGAPLPMVALLRGGTMNTIASGLRIKGSPASLLDSLVSRYHSGEDLPVAERHLLRVGDEDPQYGFLFGNGLLSNFLEAYYEGAEPSPTKAALLLARTCWSALVNGPLIQRLTRPAEVEVEVDGVKWPSNRYMTVGAGTVDDIGLRFRPFFESVRHPGRMHLLGLACNPVTLVKNLPRIWMARATDAPDIYSATPRRVLIRAERPHGYMVDGDFHTMKGQSLLVEVGPPVRFVLG